jgi:hypothetical protein
MDELRRAYSAIPAGQPSDAEVIERLPELYAAIEDVLVARSEPEAVDPDVMVMVAEMDAAARSELGAEDTDYAALAANGTINAERYHHDPVYHAIVYRLRSEPGAEGLRLLNALAEHHHLPGSQRQADCDICRYALAATPPADSPRSEAGLDAAWEAVLAVLPKGWGVGIEPSERGYEVGAGRNQWHTWTQVAYPGLAEALIDLAALLASDDREAGS